MNLSRSSFYAWQSREPSARGLANVELANVIRRINIASRKSYDAPRFHAELPESGVHVGRKRVIFSPFPPPD